MNRDELNSLQQELARGHLGEPHPDPDLLTAFAEGSLMQRERQQVLAHLAACAECREVLTVAVEVAPEAAATLKPFLVPRRALWPQRLWLPWASIAAGILAVCSAALLYHQQQSSQKHAEVAVNETAQLPATTFQQPSPLPSPEVNQTRANFANAAPGQASTFASSSAQRPHWRINSIGQPERSIGDGAWQSVLPQEQSKMRVVFVSGFEVWIGGENSRLYHSTDNGATWKLVALPSKDGRTHDIVHIHFLTTQSGKVEAEDGTLWTTSNSGATWN